MVKVFILICFKINIIGYKNYVYLFGLIDINKGIDFWCCERNVFIFNDNFKFLKLFKKTKLSWIRFFIKFIEEGFIIYRII